MRVRRAGWVDLPGSPLVDGPAYPSTRGQQLGERTAAGRAGFLRSTCHGSALTRSTDSCGILVRMLM
jgi:hypothetical protein